nr:hypothetical protein CDCA019_057 [Cyanidium caldarium]
MIIMNIQHHLNSCIAYIEHRCSKGNHHAENRIRLSPEIFNAYCSKKIVIKSSINKCTIKKVYKNSTINQLENITYNIDKKKLKLLLRKIGDLGYFTKVSISNYYYPRQEVIKIHLSPNKILKTIKTKKKFFIPCQDIKSIFEKQFDHPKNIKHLLHSYQNLAEWHLKRNINFVQIYIEENLKKDTQTKNFSIKTLGNKNIKWIYNTSIDTCPKNNTDKKKSASIINPPLTLKKIRNRLKQEPSLEHEYKIIQVESSEQILLLVDISNLDRNIYSFVWINKLNTQLWDNYIKEIKTINCKNKNWNSLNSTREDKKSPNQKNRNVFFKKLFHCFESSKIYKTPKLYDFKQFNQVKLKYDNLKGRKHKIDFVVKTTNNGLFINLKEISPWEPKISHGDYYLQKEFYRRINYLVSNYELFASNSLHKHYSYSSFIEKGTSYHLSRRLYPNLIISTDFKLIETFAESIFLIKNPYINFHKRLSKSAKIEKNREEKLCTTTLEVNKKHKMILLETGISKQDDKVKINNILNPNSKLSLKITNILLASNAFLRTFFIQIQAQYVKVIKLRQFNYYYFDKIETGEATVKINYVPKDINFIENILTNPQAIRSKTILNRRISTPSYQCKSSIEYYLQLNENLNSIFFLLNYTTKLNQFRHLKPTYPIKDSLLRKVDYLNEISMGIGAQTFDEEDKASVLRLEYCLSNSKGFFLTFKLLSIT